MAVAYQTQGQAFASGATGAAPKPAGLTVGDLMVCLDGVRTSGALESVFTAPANWTGFHYYGGQSGGTSGKLWWKFATSADVSATTFSFGHTSAAYVTTVVRFTGADPTTPIIETVAGAQSTTATTTAPSATSIADGYVINLYTSNRGTSFVVESGIAVELSDRQTGSTTTSYTQMFAGAVTPGVTTGTATTTVAEITTQYARTFTIRPAAGGGTEPPALPIIVLRTR